MNCNCSKRLTFLLWKNRYVGAKMLFTDSLSLTVAER